MTSAQKASALLLSLFMTPGCGNSSDSPTGSPTPTPTEPPRDHPLRRLILTSPDSPRWTSEWTCRPCRFNEREALNAMVEAARIIDGIFLQQVWSENAGTLVRLAADRSPEGQKLLHYFLINKGPWSRLDENKPFVPASVKNLIKATSTRPMRRRKKLKAG